MIDDTVAPYGSHTSTRNRIGLNACTLSERRRKVCYPQASNDEKVKCWETSIFRPFVPPKTGLYLPPSHLLLGPSFPLARVLVGRKVASLIVREALGAFFFLGEMELPSLPHLFAIIGLLLCEYISWFILVRRHSCWEVSLPKNRKNLPLIVPVKSTDENFRSGS